MGEHWKRRNCSGPPDCRPVVRKQMGGWAAWYGRLYAWLEGDKSWCAQESPEGVLPACQGTVMSDPFVAEVVDLFFGWRLMGVQCTAVEFAALNPRTRLGLLSAKGAMNAIENWQGMPTQAELTKRKADANRKPRR